MQKRIDTNLASFPASLIRPFGTTVLSLILVGSLLVGKAAWSEEAEESETVAEETGFQEEATGKGGADTTVVYTLELGMHRAL